MNIEAAVGLNIILRGFAPGLSCAIPSGLGGRRGSRPSRPLKHGEILTGGRGATRAGTRTKTEISISTAVFRFNCRFQDESLVPGPDCAECRHRKSSSSCGMACRVVVLSAKEPVSALTAFGLHRGSLRSPLRSERRLANFNSKAFLGKCSTRLRFQIAFERPCLLFIAECYTSLVHPRSIRLRCRNSPGIMVLQAIIKINGVSGIEAIRITFTAQNVDIEKVRVHAVWPAES